MVECGRFEQSPAASGRAMAEWDYESHINRQGHGRVMYSEAETNGSSYIEPWWSRVESSRAMVESSRVK